MKHLLLAAACALATTLSAEAQTVVLSTTAGEIRVAVDAEKAPKSAANFLAYVKAGHYDGTVFHRVISDFMVQGGGFTAKMDQKPTKAPVPLESRNGLRNVRGSLAMARTNDPNSATAQFFINVVDNGFLDADQSRDGQGYAVFAQVISGMEVVDKIRAVPVQDKGPFQNVPVTPIVITKARIEAAPKK